MRRTPPKRAPSSRREGEEQMLRANEGFLQAVHEVPGVLATFLVNNRGEVLLSAGQRVAAGVSATLGIRVMQMLAAVEMVDNGCEELSLQFDQSNVVVFARLGLGVESRYGVEEVILAALTTPKVNPSMLRMTVKVAAAKLKSDPDAPGRTSGQISRRNLLQKNYLDEAGVEMLKALVRA
jgi:hypothetical protein